MHDPVSSDIDSATIVKETSEHSKETPEEEFDSTSSSNIEAIQETSQENGEEPEVLSGFALNLLVAGISLAGFIYSLDISIIVTVSSKTT